MATTTATTTMKYSWEEIHKHCTPEDGWLVINQKVYDVSNWTEHPGGSVMFTQLGEDASDSFAVFHMPNAFKYLKQFHIGDLKESSGSHGDVSGTSEQFKKEEFLQAYRKLRTKIKAMGLYDASYVYYGWKLISTLLIAIASGLMCFYFNSLPMYIFAGAVMGLFYQQCGWLAHDFLHNQVFQTHDYGDLIGVMVGNIWQGFSVQWWKNKHNTHHAVPNLHGSGDIGFMGDPDIDTMPLLAWSIKMAEKAKDSSFGTFMIEHQAYFYFPLLLFARISWLLQSYLYVFKEFAFGPYDPCSHRTLEKIGLILHYSWNLLLIYYSNMSILEGVAFFLASCASCGLLLALVFSIGHNGMAVYEKDTQPDFWNLQVSTTRNVTGNVFIDWFCGGLNYQVDHHLFPLIPRHNLKKVNVLVQSICKEYNVPYYETGFWQGIAEVVGYLSKISYEFLAEFPKM